MKVLTSYSEGIDQCMISRSFSIVQPHGKTGVAGKHSHCCYEFYFSPGGGSTFLIGDKSYRAQPGDLFMINQNEKHQAIQTDSSVSQEILAIFIDPSYLENISTDQTDLTYCFTHRPRQFSHRLSLTPDQQRRFTYYLNRLGAEGGFGQDVEDRSVFSQLMVFLTKLTADAASGEEFEKHSPYSNPKVADIITYIHYNIDSQLSIGEIASHFYLSTSYLCRLFKKDTGTTINSYITSRRIELAQTLLSGGYSVNEVYSMCGFNDYSNFFKAFTKKVGISPRKYSQSSLSG
ncbi:MAG: AraC family transcriptional regulator [Lacrimispora sp.]|uniref:AraC family transcriptional regulator n=1 Tax=Lacrimispora sp. TaxID=2719234 RepID=UPI0039E4F4D4